MSMFETVIYISRCMLTVHRNGNHSTAESPVMFLLIAVSILGRIALLKQPSCSVSNVAEQVGRSS